MQLIKDIIAFDFENFLNLILQWLFNLFWIFNLKFEKFFFSFLVCFLFSLFFIAFFFHLATYNFGSILNNASL